MTKAFKVGSSSLKSKSFSKVYEYPGILECLNLQLCCRGCCNISKISSSQVLIDYASAEAGRFYLFSQVDCESLILTTCPCTAKWIKLFKKFTIQKRDAVPHLMVWEHLWKRNTTKTWAANILHYAGEQCKQLQGLRRR